MKNAQERGGEFIEKMNEILIIAYFLFVILQNNFLYYVFYKNNFF